jgi:predicted ATPase
MKRYENYEQAKLIQNHLIETYEGYGYRLVEVPKDTIDNRIFYLRRNI